MSETIDLQNLAQLCGASRITTAIYPKLLGTVAVQSRN